jgi:hypothetical protein
MIREFMVSKVILFFPKVHCKQKILDENYSSLTSTR